MKPAWVQILFISKGRVTCQGHETTQYDKPHTSIHGLQAVDAVYFKLEERLDKYWPKFEEYASRNSFFVPENLQLPEQVNSLGTHLLCRTVCPQKSSR